MPRLYMITVPGLTVALDWAPVHDRLLDDFPEIADVLATTMPATLLIVYEGDSNVDAWLEGISDGILSRRMRAGTSSRPSTRSSASASGSAGSRVRTVDPAKPLPHAPRHRGRRVRTKALRSTS